MSKHQGVVSSVREFAAAHASLEEKKRSSRQMNELLRIDKLEEAQRRMAELARYAILEPASLNKPLLFDWLTTLTLLLFNHFFREKVRSAVNQAKTKEMLPQEKPPPQEERPEDDSDLGDLNAEVRTCHPRACCPAHPSALS